MKIEKDIRNELLKRQELVVSLESEKNPSFEEVKKKISEELGKSDENIDVLRIKGGFGRAIFVVEAYIYDDEKDLKKMIELRKTKKQKKAEKEVEEKAKEENSVEESSEEKPAEQSVEEKPSESEEPVKDETPVEDKKEEEEKTVKEEQQKQEEIKEN